MLSNKHVNGHFRRIMLSGTVVSAAIVMLMFNSSCKKMLDVTPKYIKTSGQVYATDISADSVVVGLYFKLANSNTYGVDIPLSTGFSSDEIVPNPNGFGFLYVPLYNNTLDANTALTNAFWTDSYNIIYTANAIIEGVANSSGMTTAGKKRCTGEAELIRAFAYFYLTNFYGDVPLVTTTSYAVSSVLPRTPTALVYQQMVKDLLSAESNLGDNYPTPGRVRANKWVAKALLARVYLYMGDWVNSNTKSSELIANSATYSLGSMKADSSAMDIFHAGNKEAIWQTWTNTGTGLGGYTLGNYTSYLVSNNVLTAFEPGDLRKINYIGYSPTLSAYYINKYRLDGSTTESFQEYTMVLRLAEQYLIRAEARAQQGNLAGAQSDINAIRNRAGLANTTAADQTSLLSAIEQERRVELCYEWADRWLNLKRTGHLDAVMQADKPLFWKPTAALYPIPRIEIQNNKNLTQNPGY